MKSTIILFFVMTAYIFSQSWNNTVTTTINEPNLVKMDLFTNKDGNHIIVQNSNSTNSIKYYLLNSSGTVVRSSTIETSGYAEFPNISGDNDKVYLVYKLGSNLKVRRSTNAGQSWLSDINNLSIGSNTCNGVDIVYADNGVHVVYAMKDSDPYYETYYYKINSSGSWVDYKNVTDYTVDEVGGFPSIAVSDNRVHVGYNTKGQDNPLIGIGTAKIRTKEGANWLAPEIIVENISFIERVYADNTYLYDFYYENYFGRGDIYVKKRELNGSTWTDSTLLHLGGDQLSLISAATHLTGKLRVVYSQPGVHFYREFSGNWTEPFELGNGFGANMSSVYNDLFVIFHNNGIISYRQCDEAPAPPQNLTVTSYNGHPKLTWNRNVDPDIKQYRIYKKKETSNFVLIGSVSKNTLEFVDSDELAITDPPSHQMGIVPAYYKIKARDNGNKDSEFSNQVTSWVYSELPQISWFTNG